MPGSHEFACVAPSDCFGRSVWQINGQQLVWPHKPRANRAGNLRLDLRVVAVVGANVNWRPLSPDCGRQICPIWPPRRLPNKAKQKQVAVGVVVIRFEFDWCGGGGECYSRCNNKKELIQRIAFDKLVRVAVFARLCSNELLGSGQFSPKIVQLWLGGRCAAFARRRDWRTRIRIAHKHKLFARSDNKDVAPPEENGAPETLNMAAPDECPKNAKRRQIESIARKLHCRALEFVAVAVVLVFLRAKSDARPHTSCDTTTECEGCSLLDSRAAC